jgi:hypothetical protein
MAWIFYLSLLYLNFFPCLVILSFSPSFQNYFPFRDLVLDILPLSSLSKIFPFLNILSFSPSVQNFFPCRGIIFDILLFPLLSQLLHHSNHSFFFLPLFRIFSFHRNGLGYFSLLSVGQYSYPPIGSHQTVNQG